MADNSQMLITLLSGGNILLFLSTLNYIGVSDLCLSFSGLCLSFSDIYLSFSDLCLSFSELCLSFSGL